MVAVSNQSPHISSVDEAFEAETLKKKDMIKEQKTYLYDKMTMRWKLMEEVETDNQFPFLHCFYSHSYRDFVFITNVYHSDAWFTGNLIRSVWVAKKYYNDKLAYHHRLMTNEHLLKAERCKITLSRLAELIKSIHEL